MLVRITSYLIICGRQECAEMSKIGLAFWTGRSYNHMVFRNGGPLVRFFARIWYVCSHSLATDAKVSKLRFLRWLLL